MKGVMRKYNGDADELVPILLDLWEQGRQFQVTADGNLRELVTFEEEENHCEKELGNAAG